MAVQMLSDGGVNFNFLSFNTKYFPYPAKTLLPLALIKNRFNTPILYYKNSK